MGPKWVITVEPDGVRTLWLIAENGTRQIVTRRPHMIDAAERLMQRRRG